jgi:hypothetical protein
MALSPIWTDESILVALGSSSMINFFEVPAAPPAPAAIGAPGEKSATPEAGCLLI